MNVGALERGTGDARVLLVVAAGSAVSALTAKDLLDEPTVGQYLEAFGFGFPSAALDDVQQDTALLLDRRPKPSPLKPLSA